MIASAATDPPQHAAVVTWLTLCCLLVFGMVLLGGAVRLTGSGLSIVDWRPLRGIVPPLEPLHWAQLFAKYQQFAEFKLLNPDLTLAQFQFIFWMEYAHRLLGRLLGVVFLLPLVFFWRRRWLPRAALGKLCALFLLGALQGLLGWYLVNSGLADEPRISPYRLAMHFMLAVVIYAYLLRVLVGFCPRARAAHNRASAKVAASGGGLALATLLLMFASGVLVAATDGGQIYNTWPKMGDQYLPPQLFALQPAWRNFFENIITIQFAHRTLAVIVLLAVGAFALRLMRAAPASAPMRSLGALMLAAVVGQVILGIATLLQSAPIALALAHQAGAMALLSLVVFAVASRLPSFPPLAAAPAD